jgi:hypothetical protein
MFDILEMVINGEISDDEACDLADMVLERFHSGEIKVPPMEELNLDEYEWTAVGFGISWTELAKWRKYGWPKQCFNCGKEINYKDYGWMISDDKLKGITCCRENP